MTGMPDRRAMTVTTTWAALVAAAVFGLAVVGDQDHVFRPFDWRLALLTLGIALSVPLRIHTVTGRELAPVTQSIALATATTPVATTRSIEYGTAVIVLAMIGGSAAGLLLGAGVRRPWREPSVLAAHLLGAVVTALVFRHVPMFAGHTGLANSALWQHSGWRTACVVALSCAVGVLVDLVLQILMTAPPRLVLVAGEHLALRSAPFWTAVLGTSVAITLGFGPLDLWSVPIMASPLVLLRTAVRRRTAVGEVRDEGVRSLSGMPEIGRYVPTGHALRVQELCRLVGEQLLVNDADRKALMDAALLHDLGQLGLPVPLPSGAVSEAAPVDQTSIAEAGAGVVRIITSLDRTATVVAAQSTPFRNVRELGQDVPVAARILKVCNAYDELTGGVPDRRGAALERLSLGMGYEYDPDVVDLLTHLTRTVSSRSGSRRS